MARKLFGTDGVRGVANCYPMTADMALKLGQALAITLEKGQKKRKKVVIGKDTRISGYMLEYALTSGLCSMGVDVYLVGPMPTPAIAHLTKSFAADAGIVISASHNPAEDNGIKIFSSDGFKLPDEAEEEIERLIFSDKLKTEHINSMRIGKAHRIDDARGRYIEFVKSSIGNSSLKGLKAVIDCANGAAYAVADDIFSELGAEIITMNANPNGLNINEQCGALHPHIVSQAVLRHQADIGIALDGDADRVIIVDEKGEVVDGDHIMAIAAINLKKENRLMKDTVVGTDYSNLGLEIALKEHGITLVRTKVGDRHIMDEMKKHDYSLGGEQSGHIIFYEHTTTGDGLITALQVMNLMMKTGKKLSQLKQVMKPYPQVIVSIDVRDKKPFEKMPKVAKKIREIEARLKGKGRLFVRYSGTQNCCRIMIEAKDGELVKRCVHELAATITKEIGKK